MPFAASRRAFVYGLAAYFLGRKSVLAGVLAAETVVVSAAWWLGVR